ncbi:NO-inducible flavohemoprotein [Salinisphaera orenii]|uniref:Flavohemoprotein n=1 Tax=Salinisphaera orenii YIM 95161 TaxID=1051139 RepID=A0A423PIR7_9GAMM|nr:NO-inducible flavohemoprotein [Salinisphaera halophila]ROO25477.1 nitric oxide dioxygenase [Salinisphaera halophila YIM 95161]
MSLTYLETTVLTDQQKSIVKQTVPVLQAHGETLTRHFYERMFRVNPEVRDYFNPAHQHSGSQQRALAGAILAYAQHIDNPAVLGDAVELIAQKHASLSIQPEHYPIVGDNLLASIREVLGEAATDDIIDAWAAAYAVLADIFIAREKQIYSTQDAVYGWHGFKSFIVDRREKSSDNIASFYLKPLDGQPLAAHAPGQYITIRATLANGQTVMRNYSLSNPPGSDYYRISVKREPAAAEEAPHGIFSNYVHDRIYAGDRVELSPPCGEFTLEMPDNDHTALVFIAGGVGVTPIISMLHAAVENSNNTRPIIFIQGALNGAVQAFSDELKVLKTKHPNLSVHVRYDAPREADRAAGLHDSEGLIDATLLDEMVGEQLAAYYFCGPTPMLEHVHALLRERGVPEQDLHYEFFGPGGKLAA